MTQSYLRTKTVRIALGQWPPNFGEKVEEAGLKPNRLREGESEPEPGGNESSDTPR